MDPVQALQKVSDMCAELQKNALSTVSVCNESPASDEGISLLQAKSSTLLRYNLNLMRMARLRVQGKPISNVAERLVEDWVALEKIRPLERRLRYQIDALLKSASAPPGNDRNRHRPDPSAVVVDSDVEEEADEGAMYRPPRIAEVVFDGDGERRKEREKRQRERAHIRKMRSEGVQEMLAEVKGRPEVLREEDFGSGRKSAAVTRLLKEDEQRTKYEEEHFTRLTVTRKDKKRRRDIERALEAQGMDVANEFGGLVAIADRVAGVKGSTRGQQSKVAGSGVVAAREEEEKIKALDEITDRMSGGTVKARRAGKRRRK